MEPLVFSPVEVNVVAAQVDNTVNRRAVGTFSVSGKLGDIQARTWVASWRVEHNAKTNRSLIAIDAKFLLSMDVSGGDFDGLNRSAVFELSFRDDAACILLGKAVDENQDDLEKAGRLVRKWITKSVQRGELLIALNRFADEFLLRPIDSFFE